MSISQDLRERIVKLRIEGLTQDEISERLLIPQSSVSRILKRHRETGSLSVNKPPRRPRQFTPENDAFILKKVHEKPDITLAELIESVSSELGKKVSVTVIQDSIKRLKLTRKKRRFTILPKI